MPVPFDFTPKEAEQRLQLLPSRKQAEDWKKSPEIDDYNNRDAVGFRKFVSCQGNCSDSRQQSQDCSKDEVKNCPNYVVRQLFGHFAEFRIHPHLPMGSTFPRRRGAPFP